jgi:diguanylate cyclase (GGDEF)-like protein
MALINNTSLPLVEGQGTLSQDALNLSLDLIARNPEFAGEQLKILLSHLQQLLQASNRQAMTSCLMQDSSLTSFQRKLLMEFLEGSDKASIANRDELTGLLTRSSLLDRLSQEALRTGSERNTLAICFIDLDDFKVINDQHGHAVGDQVLVEISARILAAIRPTDLVVRWGGDEFIVLFTGVQTADLVMQLATRLLGIITTPLQLNPDNPMRLFLSASIGVAVTTDEKIPVTEFIEQADRAMYLAKKSGKNSIQIFA